VGKSGEKRDLWGCSGRKRRAAGGGGGDNGVGKGSGREREDFAVRERRG